MAFAELSSLGIGDLLVFFVMAMIGIDLENVSRFRVFL
jgi:hypothetical protein